MKKEKSEGYWEIGDKKTNKPTEVIAWLMVEKAKLEEENKRLSRNWEEEIEACMGWWKKAQELENEIEDLRYNAKWNAIRDIVLGILILIGCIINQTF